MRVLLLLLMFVMASEVQAFKFTCNGVDAHGKVESDKCGAPCDDVGAARWVPGDVEVRIDFSVFPSGIDQKTWKKVALSSMESWNTVSGANFKYRFGGSTVNRSFGSDSRYHEIFWVIDANEWITNVGSGEKGTLAVTLSPYLCPNSIHPYRETIDGDVMLNGTEDFPWQASCKDRNCQSILSTLTHELGHMAGLGHPCVLCSNSIMTSKAGFNTEYPMFDDQEGLRALYPGTSSGNLGSRCDKNSECNNGQQCISQGNAKYCSQNCSADQACPPGYACDENMCQFAIGRLSGAVGLGESCQTKYCEADLLCVGADKVHQFCYIGCLKSGDCQQAETCVPLEGETSQGVCIHEGKLGESCHWKNPCVEKLICVVEDDKGNCRVPCTLGQKNTCAQAETCRDLGQGKSACWGNSVSPSVPTTIDKTGSLCTSSPMRDESGWTPLLSLLVTFAVLRLRRLSFKRQ